MREPRPRHTLRVPRQLHGPSGWVAQQMREVPNDLDEVSRARIERSTIQAWRTRAAAVVPLPRARRVSTGMRVARSVWAASLAASAVAGGLIAFYMLAGAHRAPPVQVGSGRFELHIGEAAMQSGAVAEGQVLESGQHGWIDVDLGTARVQMAAGTRLRFDRMAERELKLSVLKGRVDVDFHPRHKGEQVMQVESLAATVHVVGTRFAVEVDVLGNTEVAVNEGVVEVVPRSGAEPHKVAAGERLEVRADDGDDSERAVRNALEAQLNQVPASDRPEAGVQAAVPVPGQSGAHDVGADMVFDLDATSASPELGQNATNQLAARRLALARRMLHQARHAAARERLREVADSAAAIRYRVEALTLMAESYTAQGDIPRATEAYTRADEIAPNDPAGHNARFALARLLERFAHDDEAAKQAYLRYLERAPGGALAEQAHQALCRLGEQAHCE